MRILTDSHQIDTVCAKQHHLPIDAVRHLWSSMGGDGLLYYHERHRQIQRLQIAA
jgi:hypothetical protein